MKGGDWKYLLAYIPSALAFLGLTWGGTWTFATVLFAFGLVPALEVVLPHSDKNIPKEEESSKSAIKIFDWLLYLNIPILYALLWYYFSQLLLGGWTGFEILGMTLSVGIVASTVGINVAHELGHRDNKTEQHLSRILLLPSLYLHFNIEHNLGHHKHVATEKDPATARMGENIYFFWFRSVIGSYLSAWKIEGRRLRGLAVAQFSIQNKMLQFTLVQLIYLLGIGLAFGWTMLPFAIVVAVISFLLLETVNYVEHYGLMRKKLSSGRYEKVMPRHSWNSDHELGRILLYELTRHSDHHYKATRKYQILRHLDESPQMPYGYPAAMLMSLLPPLWFSVMDQRARSFAQQA